MAQNAIMLSIAHRGAVLETGATANLTMGASLRSDTDIAGDLERVFAPFPRLTICAASTARA